jgi:hypothetical protein
MSEVQARLRAALEAIAEADVDGLNREEIEDALVTLDDGIRPEEDADGTVSVACAAVGRLDLLVEARALGYPWYERTCANAAENGHLECLKYAHEHGCPWDELTCRYAAMNGHLECLKYAHEHGCPWNADTYICAMSNRNMEVILFLIEREHPHAQSLRPTWEEVAMPIFPDADAVIGLEIALSRHRHRHDADGGHVSLREILSFWREHRRLYDEAHRAARVDALLPEIDKERRRIADARRRR